MDIQDIARLHTSYAQPPLTIEMASPGGATPMLDGPAATGPATEATSIWSRFSIAQRQAIAVLVVAAVAFPIGMWTASGGKHDNAPRAATAPAVGPLSAAASTSDAKGHEWPSKDTPEAPAPSATVAASLPAAPASSAPVLAPPQPGSEASSATADSSAIPGATPAKQPNKPAAKAPAQTAAKPVPAPAAMVPAQTAHAPEPRRNNEIKLF